MRFFILFIVSLLSFIPNALAQGEANIWYFGDYAGLDFNSGTPVVLNDGVLNTIEGCSSISDSAGGLLFYTNGRTVWNKNHRIMMNGMGLKGHKSTSQSALIIKNPNSFVEFYIFTVDYEGRSLNYSVVDLSLSGGLGTVNVKNNMLLLTSAEKLDAISNSICGYAWVMAHGHNTDTFYAYKITAAGLDTTPVTSNVGSVTIGGGWEAIGQMKFSPDANLLAVAWTNKTEVQLFDFDNITGIVSNPRTVYDYPRHQVPAWPNFIAGAYGVEFSPSSNVLYISAGKLNIDGSYVFQYDLTAADIKSSEQTITDSQENIGGIQLGPDGKIYLARINESYLSVINNPNLLGSSCGFQDIGVSLGNRVCRSSLPGFVKYNRITLQSSILGPDIILCQSQHWILNATTPNATYLWQDGSEDSSNIVKSTGIYWVEINVNGCIARDSIEVEYRRVDQTVTQNSSTLTANADNAAYQWLNCDGFASIEGATNQSFSPTASGSYAVVVSQNECADTSECYTVVGVDDRGLANNIKLYPNPTTGTLHLNLGTYYPEVEIKITNILGQVIGKVHSQNTNNINLEIEGGAGIYFVVIKTGASLPVVIKVIKR